MSKKYELSAILYGHSMDVRGVTVTNSNSIISGSRDKTAKFWTSNGINTGYHDKVTYKDQKNFVIAVLYVEPSEKYPQGLVITGGNDNVIYAYQPNEYWATFSIKEHTDAVCSLSKGLKSNTLLSGSWDSSAKFYDLNVSQTSSVCQFTGHTSAVWSAIQLSDGHVATASADKSIILWSSSSTTTIGKKLSVLSGHTDCVRGLADMAEVKQFVSVSNDASVRVWNYLGENINTLYGHTNFIYSVVKINMNCFATSDEDRTVRVWENGENIDTFYIPAQSIWSVACLSSNGDLVTGSSDGLVRIFTRDTARYADQATRDAFAKEIEAIHSQTKREIGGVKVEDLPGKEILYEPGKKPGELRMVREGNMVVAYTWKESDQEEGGSVGNHWEKVGEVLGGTDKDEHDKTVFEGKSYDFVFSVDVEDGKPPLKLPYNRGGDVYKAANDFLTKNNLPSSYLEQVVDFILKNSREKINPPTNPHYTDPFTGESRYTPNNVGGVGGSQGLSTGVNSDPFTGGSSYSTSTSNQEKTQLYFPLKSYRTFDMGDPRVIISKLKEFNQKINTNNLIEDATTFDKLSEICNEPSTTEAVYKILYNILYWPNEYVFPALDIMRLSIRNLHNSKVILHATQDYILPKLIGFINNNTGILNNTVVALRTLTNLFLHGEHILSEFGFQILEEISVLPVEHPIFKNKGGQIALITLLLNFTILPNVASKDAKDDESLLFIMLADLVPNLMLKLHDVEALFRGYVAIGTLLSLRPQYSVEIRARIHANTGFLVRLNQHSVATVDGDLENKMRNCAKQVLNIL